MCAVPKLSHGNIVLLRWPQLAVVHVVHRSGVCLSVPSVTHREAAPTRPAYVSAFQPGVDVLVRDTAMSIYRGIQ